MNESVKRQIQKIPSLPTLPAVAQDILMLIESDVVSLGKLESIIEQDPAISVRIMSLANSAFWGGRTPARTLDEAIFRIGFESVRYLAVGVSVLTLFDDVKGERKVQYQKIYNHSVATGFIAKLLARRVALDFSEEILINAILHDIGILALNRYFADANRKVIELTGNNQSLLEAEKAVFDFTHAELGSWLAEAWNLHDSVVNTILHHHAPSLAAAYDQSVAVVHVADYITTYSILSPTVHDPLYSFDPVCLDVLGLSKKDVKEFESEIKSGELMSGLFMNG